MAAGGIAVAATLALGVAGAAAAPNPGYGTDFQLIPSQTTPTVAPAVYNPDPFHNGIWEQTEDGPQTANIPILAWVGEDVRLTACDSAIKPNPLSHRTTKFQQAVWTGGNDGNLWTGDQAVPPAFDGSQGTNLTITNTGSTFFFYPSAVDSHEKGCVSAQVHSLHAGLDEITLNVLQESSHGPDSNNDGSNGLDPIPVYSEQFIVIWMTANKPSITEASTQSLSFPTSAAGELTAPTSQISPVTGVNNLKAFLGDPSGNGVFSSLDAWGADSPYETGSWDHGANDTPLKNNGLVQVRVTGSFPIEDQFPATTNQNYFSGITGGGNPSSITLPAQWKALANLMASSSSSYQGTNGGLWDIHGSPTNTLAVQGHAGSSSGVCQYDNVPSNFGNMTDVVDSCASNGAGVGNPFAFSRVFGDLTSVGNTIGPFDAEAPNATLLSDGSLNSDDAPMPALPVTVSIAPGGLGGLYGVSKWMIYSHDFNGTGPSPLNTPTPASALTSTGTGNLYNPYYQEYIPSTLRPINEASGITGVYNGGGVASSGDNFPGFSLGWTNPYTFWKALNVSTTDKPSVSNGCLEYDGNVGGTTQDFTGTENQPGQVPSLISSGGLHFYGTPYYPKSLVVYTDERGEAFVDYNPGTGFNYNGGLDKNGACDLQPLFGQPLGTSSIQATANYPYEAVPYPAIPASATLTKTVDSQWSKTLTVYPKSNISGNEVSVVVVHAQNVNGSAFSGEEVCVQVPANDSVFWDSLNPLTVTTPPIDTSGSSGHADNLSNNTCGYTGTAGNVAFDVSGSNNQTNVDVQALFVPEHILRDVNIPVLGQTGTVTSTSPPSVLPPDPVKAVFATGTAGSGGGTSAAGPTSSGAPSAAPSTSGTPLIVGAHAAHVTFARLVHGRKGTSLKLDVSSSNATATLTIKVRGRHHRTRILHVTIKTNTTVTINLGSGAVLGYSVSMH